MSKPGQKKVGQPRDQIAQRRGDAPVNDEHPGPPLSLYKHVSVHSDGNELKDEPKDDGVRVAVGVRSLEVAAVKLPEVEVPAVLTSARSSHRQQSQRVTRRPFAVSR